MAKPTPRVVSEVCLLCGLDWNLHGKAPTAETCVKLLLDEVTSLNARLAWYTSTGASAGSKTGWSSASQSANGLFPQPLSLTKGTVT